MQKILIILIIIISASTGAITSILIGKNNITEKDIGVYNNKGNLKEVENNITSLVKKVSPSIVSIIIKKDLSIYRNDPWGFFQYNVGSIEKKVGGGTGFFISKDGIIITNKHVVEDTNAKYSVILNNGEELEAEIIAIKKDSDIAFLKILSTEGFSPLSFTPLEFTNKSEIKIGQFGIAIGNALAEFQNSVSLGVVSGIDRKVEDNYTSINGLIQTDTAINPGNSGGPLLNLEGKVMGINTLIINGSQNIGFAIQINQEEIDNILKTLKKDK